MTIILFYEEMTDAEVITLNQSFTGFTAFKGEILDITPSSNYFLKLAKLRPYTTDAFDFLR